MRTRSMGNSPGGVGGCWWDVGDGGGEARIFLCTRTRQRWRERERERERVSGEEQKAKKGTENREQKRGRENRSNTESEIDTEIYETRDISTYIDT